MDEFKAIEDNFSSFAKLLIEDSAVRLKHYAVVHSSILCPTNG